jgi:hypothetical protein
MNHYNVYGMDICSEVTMPEFEAARKGRIEEPDINIKYGTVPERLENPTRTGVCYQLGRMAMLHGIEGTARYLAKDGDSITVDVSEGADDSDVAYFLTNAPIAAVMLQRGLLPVYGGAIERYGKGIIICGDSGIGKSTIIHGLVKRGYNFLSDDLCTIDISGDELIVHPGSPCHKLQEHAIRTSVLEHGSYRRTRKAIDKYIVPVNPEKIVSSAVPLLKILFIYSWNKDEFSPGPIENDNEKFNSLHNSMHRQFLVGMGSGFKQMKITARLMSEVPAFKIFRIQKKNTLTEMLDMIEKDILT